MVVVGAAVVVVVAAAGKGTFATIRVNFAEVDTNDKCYWKRVQKWAITIAAPHQLHSP